MRTILFIAAVCSSEISAFVPQSTALLRSFTREQPGLGGRRTVEHTLSPKIAIIPKKATLDSDDSSTPVLSSDPWVMSSAAVVASTALVVPIMMLVPEAAMAAAPNTAVLPNALVAYGHYFFLLIIMGLATFERATVKANMSIETEKSLVIADAIYGLSAVFLLATGYLRATEYGKGWDFYSHEPLFWLKMASFSLVSGLSLFPTITLVKRGIKIFQDEPIDPMSEKLAARMQSILNAEISAILTVPLLATLMARGVGYNAEFPWQAGAAFTGLTLIGSGFLYAKQALTWTEDDGGVIKSSSQEQ